MDIIQKMREDFQKVKATLTVVAPFISSLLTHIRIVANHSAITESMSSAGVMTLSPSRWEGYGWTEKAWVCGHELFHEAFRDLKRMGYKNHDAWNIICDCVNNDMMSEMLKMPKDEAMTMYNLYNSLKEVLDALNIKQDEFYKMTKEEIYRILPKSGSSGSGELACPKCGSKNIICVNLDVPNQTADLKCNDCGHEWQVKVEFGHGQGSGTAIPIKGMTVKADFSTQEASGEPIQDGNPDFYKEGRETDGEEVDERWKGAIANAYTMQKSIGRVPAGLRRLVDAMLKPKVDWRNLLRQSFRVGFGKTVVETWKRPSRKNPDFPGITRFTTPTTWCLVDASGSIGQPELEQFMGEIYSIAGYASVAVISWDAQAYDVVKARSRSEVLAKLATMVKGGGGTEIRNTLEKTSKNMRLRDIVLVLSDFDIGDLQVDEVKKLFATVGARASVGILCSTHQDVSIPGWRTIKLNMKND